MNKAKTPEITARLESRIRQGIYQDKLPSTRDLAAEFKTARQTITDALVPLKKTGLLQACRRNGMQIDRSKLLSGKIVIVTTEIDDIYTKLSAELVAAITADKFEALTLSVEQWTHHHQELPPDTAGVLFINSALTVEIAEELDKKHIPFASCNQLSSYPNVNVVEFDLEDTCLTLAELAAQHGYQRWSMFFSGNLEGFDETLRSSMLRVKRQLGFPHERYDDIVQSWQVPMAEKMRKTLNYMLKNNSFPDLLICRCSLDQRCMELIESPEFEPLQSMHIWDMTPPDEPCPDRYKRFKGQIRNEELWVKGYELLKLAIFTPTMRKVKRVIKQKFSIV